MPGLGDQGGDAEPPITFSFLDLLYAIPLADLAMRLSSARGAIPAVGWGDVAVVVTVVILSWYGYHRNRVQVKRRRVSQFGFFEVRFAQFLVEIGIIGVYFFMSQRVYIPDARGMLPDPVTSVWQPEFLCLIFGAYLLWDLIDVYLADDRQWRANAVRGACYTGPFVVIFLGACFFAKLFVPDRPDPVLVFDLGLIVLQYLFRILQDPGEHSVWDRLTALLARVPPSPPHPGLAVPAPDPGTGTGPAAAAPTPWTTLRSRAQEAAAAAFAPHSHLSVGAAGLTSAGAIVTACNVENASLGLTLCAECGLVSALRAGGATSLVAVTVVAADGRPLPPCGRCRQLLLDNGGPDLLVDRGPDHPPARLAELLPDAFDADQLSRPRPP